MHAIVKLRVPRRTRAWGPSVGTARSDLLELSLRQRAVRANLDATGVALHVDLGIAEGATRAHCHGWSSTAGHQDVKLPTNDVGGGRCTHALSTHREPQQSHLHSNCPDSGGNTVDRWCIHKGEVLALQLELQST